MAIIMLVPFDSNIAFAQEGEVVYADENVVVYQNDDGSKTAIISIPNDVQQGDSILVYSDPSTGTSVYIDIAEMQEVISTNSFGYGHDSWSGSVPGGTTRLIPHISTSLHSNIGFTMNITSTGSTITSVSDPTFTALFVTVSSVSLTINNATATNSSHACATMNWVATLTQGGIVAATSYCYLKVYMNTGRQLRMEWYA